MKGAAGGPDGMKKSAREMEWRKMVVEVPENEVAQVIVDAAYGLHANLGPGLLETVYEVLLANELKQRGLRVERQMPVPIRYGGVTFEEGFRADLVVNKLVIVELKSVETILPVHRKQVLTYLRLTSMRLGLLINFGDAMIKDGISRVANGLPEEPGASLPPSAPYRPAPPASPRAN